MLDIYQMEQCMGVIVGVGGQIPNNLAIPLAAGGCNILGTSPESIDNAENRFKFSKLLDRLKVKQPAWKMLTTTAEAQQFAKRIGFPVLVRPSYVLSGAAMNVARSETELTSYLSEAASVSGDAPVVVTKFMKRCKEIEYDGVANKGKIVNFAISEHVENAGVHSGDATLVLPAQNLFVETVKRVRKISAKIAEALKITGPFNIQYLARKNDIQVIECNLRCSRSFPFVSKTFNLNFVELATKVMVDFPVKPTKLELMDLDYVAVKVPMFSFTRLLGADPVLRVEMASTGEVACFGDDIYEAYLKGWLATGQRLPKKTLFISIGSQWSKLEFLESARALTELGYELYASSGTAQAYAEQGIAVEHISSEETLKRLKQKKIHMVINIPTMVGGTLGESNGYVMRRTAVDFNIPLIQNVKCAVLFVDALKKMQIRPGVHNPDSPHLSVASHDVYMRRSKIL